MVLGAAALVALVSCGAAELPQEVETLQEAVQYTAGGQRLVNLSIPTGAIDASRSPTADLAKAAVDYYEVVFFNTSESAYYRTAGVKGRTLKISVPVGNYANKAVIFAGTSDEKTLLAVGTITSNITGGSEVLSNPALITNETTSVTFTLTPLKAEIYNARTSAFKVTLAGYKTSNGNDNHYTKTIGGKDYPYFKIPANRDDITAELAITDLPNANLILATADPQLNSASSVISPASAKVLVGLENDGGILNGSFLRPAYRTVKIKINTTLDRATTDGWAAISIDIPVVALAAAANGDQWHVRSGISYTLDGGPSGDGGKSTGSCILLQVGNPGTIDITITQ